MLNGLCQCYSTKYTKGMFLAYARRILLKHVLHTLKNTEALPSEIQKSQSISEYYPVKLW